MDNIEKFALRTKQYRLDNKDQIALKLKQYYLENKLINKEEYLNDIIHKLENEQEQKEFMKQLKQNANLSKEDNEFFNSLKMKL